jgi:hypothetical protein
MAKVKKISINAFEKTIKENFENTVTKDWFGIPVTITKTISFEEVVSFVAEVADNCFLDDGRYIPEAMHALIDCGVVRHYTNISLPANLSSAYELVMQSGIIDFIMSEINYSQYNNIVLAIRDKVEYACESNAAEFNKAIEKMTVSMNEIQEATKDLFSKISPDDVQKIMGMYGDERSIEERVVEEYIKQNHELKIVGEE